MAGVSFYAEMTSRLLLLSVFMFVASFARSAGADEFFHQRSIQIGTDDYWNTQHNRAKGFGLTELEKVLVKEIPARQQAVDDQTKWLSGLDARFEGNRDVVKTREWIAAEQILIANLRAELSEMAAKKEAERLANEEAVRAARETKQAEAEQGVAAEQARHEAFRAGTDKTRWDEDRRLHPEAYVLADQVAAEVKAEQAQAKKEEALARKRAAAASVKKKQDEAQAVVLASQRCGPVPFKPHWIARNFLREKAHDPSSIDVTNCDPPVLTGRGWEWSCMARGKNMLGALVLTKVDMRSCGDQVWGR